VIVRATVPQPPPLITCYQIHLSLMGEETMAVMWNTNHTLTTPTVRYFKGSCPSSSSTYYQYAFGDSHTYKGHYGSIHKVQLTNLEKAAMYCYSVGDDDGGSEEVNVGRKEECGTGGGWSMWSEFSMTREDVGQFAAFADAGTWGETPFVMHALAKDTDVSMVIHAGDLSYGEQEFKWDDFGKLIEPVARTRPYMIIPGNWDVRPNATDAFVNRYSMPLVYPPDPVKKEMNYFYSFNYSVFHVVMLNSYDPYDYKSKQYKWLENDLRSADNDRKRHPWVVVCFHSPMYSSNTGHGGGDEKFRAQVEHLLFLYRVDLVLTGHDHGYERTYPVYNNTVLQNSKEYYDHHKAPIHILVGTAGATSDPWLERPSWSAHRETSFGYTKVIGTHSSLHVVYTRYNRSIADEFWITKSYQFSPAYIFAIAMFCFFTVLPLLLYKGLPSAVRNYLMCVDVTTPSSSYISNNSVYKFI